MINLILLLTVLTPLQECQQDYDRCVEQVAEEQATYNGCVMASGGYETRRPLSVVSAIDFADAGTCWKHLGACGYTRFENRIDSTACISEALKQLNE